MTELIQQSAPYSVQAAAILREQILSGQFRPGERVNEVGLSTALGVSRSPIREALRTLEEEGLVHLTSGRGAFVASLQLPEVKELLELRRVLDVFGARLAAERRTDQEVELLRAQLEEPTRASDVVPAEGGPWTPDLHIGLFRMGRNRKLLAQATIVHRQLRLARFRSGSMDDRVDEAKREHLAILEAIASRDAALAEDLMGIHLDNASAHIIAMMEQDTSAD